jgi:thiamine pyrophosphate-dependent acetolactate synthase large subunit-like protein
VCIATSGPGASHLVTGLYDARLDHMPVLAIAGQQARTAIGGHYQQEVDLPSLLKDVAGAFVVQASAPAQLRHLVDRAMRTALGERRVAAIIIPNDLQEMPFESRHADMAPCIQASAFHDRRLFLTTRIFVERPTSSTTERRSPFWLVLARSAQLTM